MSYLATEGVSFWETVARAAGTSKGTVGRDVIKIWSEMKGILVEKLGAYTFDDGRVQILDGKKFPRMTMSQAIALHKAWSTFGNELAAAVNAASVSTSRITSAQSRFDGDFAGWGLDVSNAFGGAKYQGKYLFILPVRDLFLIVDRFVIDLSSQAWASVNIETPLERMYESLDETTGGSLLKVPLLAAEAVSKGIPKVGWALDKLDDVAEIMKWTVVGGGLFMFYWYVLRDGR